MKDIGKQRQQLQGKHKEPITQHDHDFLNRILNDDKQDIDCFGDEGFPLVDLPPGLSEKLYAISDSENKDTSEKRNIRGNRFWHAIASLAAVVIIGLFFIEQSQQPTEQEIQRAKQELAIAFAYLNAVNKTTNAKVKQTLNARLQQVSVSPVLNVVVRPKSEEKKKL